MTPLVSARMSKHKLLGPLSPYNGGNVEKPWAGEFPLDRAEEMDEHAIAILLANIQAGCQSDRRPIHQPPTESNEATE